MALERRGNGYYYYKKEREGNRVVSRYVGSRETAELFSLLNELDANKRERKRYEKQREREKVEMFEAELCEIEETFENLITAYLLVNGYHQTASREWRKKKNGKK